MSQKRSIFQEVGTDKSADIANPATGSIDRSHKGARGAIRVWLILLFALVALTILVGGLTRLTDSGLSITECQLQNKGMTLSEFKSIYWWEWGHRQLGRFIGLVWAIGFFAFLALRRIPTGWTGRLLSLGVLGGAQGAVGWWMVSSGLSGGMLDVASYRLAIHLALAFSILGLITWYTLLLSRPERALMQARRAREPRLMRLTSWLIGLAFAQILIGALVAGIDAGRNYTDWPLMAGAFLPPDPFDITPLWRNFFENDGLVQFIHRMVGYALLAFGIYTWARARRSPHPATRRAYDLMAAMLLVQIALGIATVMHSAPWQIASPHQAGAIALWVLALRARHRAAYPLVQSIRGN